jgi:ABC-type bacteriocin/lantibiotic exporter with double-glycine peptidase domain
LLGGLALGAQRILPLLQSLYSNFTSIRGGAESLLGVLELLDQPLPSYAGALEVDPIPFRTDINICNLSFRYVDHGELILRKINLKIAKGTRLGIMGETGSGKSTLLDILMGLLTATEGGIFVDGIRLDAKNNRNWQRRIAHVPQTIFLSDSTIAENIAFGVPKNEIDYRRVKLVAAAAKIADTIESLEIGYDTRVGESGVRLSGGQRQRIGIARALYKNANVIVLDEATSALDGNTENAVMDSISNLGRDITTITVAHRLSTLRRCNVVVELHQGSIARVGSFEEVIRHT